jgi:hypothetical protein
MKTIFCLSFVISISASLRACIPPVELQKAEQNLPEEYTKDQSRLTGKIFFMMTIL